MVLLRSLRIGSKLLGSFWWLLNGIREPLLPLQKRVKLLLQSGASFTFTKHEAEGSSKLCAAHRTTFEKSTARIFILSSYVNSVFLDF